MTRAQEAALRRWLDELYRWNARINLTSVDPAAAWERHVLDSLPLVQAVPADAAAAVDVGSGAGIPGIPLAVLRPGVALTLLDGDVRRAAFLTHVAGLLGCRVTVDARRAEAAGRDPALREAFDVAVSRATAPPAVLCELALPLVRPGGVLLAVVADARAAAAAAAPAAARLGGGEPVVAAAGLLSVPKVSATDDRYPRRDGVPARRPLV